MSVLRAYWRRQFEKDEFPGLPCPACETGKVKLQPTTFEIKEPKFSVEARDHDDWGPDWITERWSARLVCDEKKCREVVLVAGDTDQVETYIEDDAYQGWGMTHVLTLRTVFPPPPMFVLPASVDMKVARQMRLAFQLYWIDLGTCVSRLRTGLERMLDEQGIATEALNKSGKKMVPLNLNNRIDLFEKQTKGNGTSELLHALRHIGNLGTHGGGLSEDDVFNSMDVIEDVLLGVYEKKSIKLKAGKLKAKKSKT